MGIDSGTATLFFSQVTVGLINGSFYALLSLGLAIIFGLLHVVNVAHGAQFMLGAYGAWALLTWFGLPYWVTLFLVPPIVGVFGVVIERVLLRHVYHIDQLYSFLLTFGLGIMVEALCRIKFGSAGLPYSNPIPGGFDLGFIFLPYYRVWVITAAVVICGSVWFAIERTNLGSYLRAAIQDAALVEAFGINVPRMVMLTYGFGVALAALAGVFAAPIFQMSPHMGSTFIVVVFAVVVVGGMGSLMGAVLAGLGLGVIEGITKAFYPEASSTAIFVVMALVLLWSPAGFLTTE